LILTNLNHSPGAVDFLVFVDFELAQKKS
jgi:hypothetical protein